VPSLMCKLFQIDKLRSAIAFPKRVGMVQVADDFPGFPGEGGPVQAAQIVPGFQTPVNV